MKKLILPLVAAAVLAGCSKDKNTTTTTDASSRQQQMLSDFSDKVALPMYDALNTKSATLRAAVVQLNASTTDANLAAARTAWVDMRSVWEQCEGFLFGPVDEGEYDPRMDTWPNDFVAMDSLLGSAQPLNESGLTNLDYSQRGFHPLEYILWGKNGAKSATAITTREKEYMVGLVNDLYSNTSGLLNAWQASGGNYAAQVATAGNGSAKFTTRQQAFLVLVDGLTGICEEVGEGKIEEPFVTEDSSLVESPYSGNSLKDFQNNMRGLQGVYMGRFGSSTGVSMHDLVAETNAALDIELQQQMTAAINAFDVFTMPFEQAIHQQRVQITNTQAALAALKTTLEDKLRPWVMANVR